MKKLLGIHGVAGSGKDTIGLIIQWLTSPFTNLSFEEYRKYGNIGTWEIKKFADKVKNIVCILTGCTKEQLESQEFKKSYSNISCYRYKDKCFSLSNELRLIYYVFESPEEGTFENMEKYKSFYTYRELLELTGTEFGRELINPDIWVYSTFQEIGEYSTIITDVRFPNELKAIKDRNGISIKVSRNNPSGKQHISETALDNSIFDYYIDNTGTIEDLIQKIKEILIKENICPS